MFNFQVLQQNQFSKSKPLSGHTRNINSGLLIILRLPISYRIILALSSRQTNQQQHYKAGQPNAVIGSRDMRNKHTSMLLLKHACGTKHITYTKRKTVTGAMRSTLNRVRRVPPQNTMSWTDMAACILWWATAVQNPDFRGFSTQKGAHTLNSRVSEWYSVSAWWHFKSNWHSNK